MSALITALFIVAAIISAVEVWLKRESGPLLAIACVVGFVAAILWRVQ
jgi:hypothetical protein